MMQQECRQRRMWFRRGIQNGIPICLGYFAVALTLGVTARNAGIQAAQAALTSFLIHASAGEYIGFTLIGAGAGYMELAVMETVANSRYLLMSCALSQRLDRRTPVWQRMVMGFFVTDEIFGLSISVPEEKLNPFYVFGMAAIAVPGWAAGTCTGVILGNILPESVVSALSVALYGMFLVVIIPSAKADKIVAGLVAVSFAASYLVSRLSFLASVSSGVKIIALTVIISLAAAVLFPREEEKRDAA